MGRLVLILVILITGTIIFICIVDDITDWAVSEWITARIRKHLPKDKK